MSDTWTVNYLPVDGGRITGQITVSPENVQFEAMYDSSNKEIVKGIFGAAAGLAVSGGHVAYIHDSGTNLEINLPRTDIASAAQVKKGLMKRAVITMQDGAEFTFDYGMLSPKKLVAAVNG